MDAARLQQWATELREREERLIGSLVGIIGGIGPMAGVRLQQLVIEETATALEAVPSEGPPDFATADARHAALLTYTNPRIPNNNRAALGIGPRSAPALIDTGRALKRSGATHLAFACSTAYAFGPEVAAGVGLPLLDMLSLVADKCEQLGHRTVGLLDVDGTHAAGAFRRALMARGVEVVVPTPEDQARAMAVVANVKARGVPSAADRVELRGVADRMSQRLDGTGVDAIVLGCTEMALAWEATATEADDSSQTRCIDSSRVLAEAIARMHLAQAEAHPRPHRPPHPPPPRDASGRPPRRARPGDRTRSQSHVHGHVRAAAPGFFPLPGVPDL